MQVLACVDSSCAHRRNNGVKVLSSRSLARLQHSLLTLLTGGVRKKTQKALRRATCNRSLQERLQHSLLTLARLQHSLLLLTLARLQHSLLLLTAGAASVD
jgi:hypothetical protein